MERLRNSECWSGIRESGRDYLNAMRNCCPTIRDSNIRPRLEHGGDGSRKCTGEPESLKCEIARTATGGSILGAALFACIYTSGNPIGIVGGTSLACAGLLVDAVYAIYGHEHHQNNGRRQVLCSCSCLDRFCCFQQPPQPDAPEQAAAIVARQPVSVQVEPQFWVADV